MGRKGKESEPLIHRQSQLAIYGEGEWDPIMSRYVGCVDLATIKLEGVALVSIKQLDALEAELKKRHEDNSLNANQKNRLLKLLDPHLDAQNDVAIELAAVLTERDPKSFFTPHQPETVGWYWYKETVPGLVQVVTSMIEGRAELCMKGGILTHAGYRDTFHPVHLMRGMWCGPIEPPTWESI